MLFARLLMSLVESRPLSDYEVWGSNRVRQVLGRVLGSFRVSDQLNIVHSTTK